MGSKATHDRGGSHAGRGFRYQDSVAAWFCVRIWAGIDPPALIIPEGNDDVERRSGGGSSLVQIKSRREHLGTLPIRDARDYLKALWERHDRVVPKPDKLELVLERSITHHATQTDGHIPLSTQLSQAFPGGTKNSALLAKTNIWHVPEPREASIAIIVERTGCPPLAAEICFAQILRQVGKLADDNGRRQPSNYLGMSASETDLTITDVLAVIDIEQIELAITSGVCEPVDFLTPLNITDFYLGVDVQPGHVAAGLVVPRIESRDALVRGLETRGAALMAGPSGAGKSAIMWDTAYALRHTVRWYRLLRIDPRDMPSIRQLLKTLRADPGSPVGLIVDDIGRRGADGWDALTRNFTAIPGAIVLGSIREEDLFLIEGRSRAVEVRAEPHPDLAKRIFEELKRGGKTEWAGWQEPWTRSKGLVLEYTHILSAGQHFKDKLAEQVAARLRDSNRETELAALRVLSLIAAAGASADPNRLASTLDATEENVARAIARLIDEHLVHKSDSRKLTGLHQLRSAELVRLTHAVPPPTISVTFSRAVKVVPTSDLEPLVADSLLHRNVSVENAIPALVSRLEQEPDIDALSAIMRGLGTAHIAASVERWLSMPNVQSLARTQIGTAVMASLMSEALPAVNANMVLANAAGKDLAEIRSDASADLRRIFLDAFPAHLINTLIDRTDDAATLNSFLAAQMGMPLHPSVHAALTGKRIDIASAPINAVVELLGTLTEVDRQLAITWVEDVGEEVLVSRIPREVPWTTEVSFENAHDGRTIRCNYHHIGIPGENNAHGDVVQICEIALALSPRSDIAASVAAAPNGQRVEFNGLALADKRIPRENLPSAALPAWNRRWRDAIAIRVATPTYTEYLQRAAELLERLVAPLERVINLILQNKNVTDAQLSKTNDVFRAATALTPPAIAAADATGSGTSEFNPHVSRLQNLLFASSADLVRRFYKLPEGAGAYIGWTEDLIRSIDEVTHDEPWELIGGAPTALEKLRTTLVAVRRIAEDTTSSQTRPAIKYRNLVKSSQPNNALRLLSARISSAAQAARIAEATNLRNALAAEDFSTLVHFVEDTDAIKPWPPSKVIVLVSIQTIKQIEKFYRASIRSRELISELRKLVVIPIVNGISVPEMGLAGYTTMFPLSEADKDFARRLKLPSSPSRAWTTFDQTAAIASALQSMDRLSLGIRGRAQSEIERREQLEEAFAAGTVSVNAIVAPLDQNLADEAVLLLNRIRYSEDSFADAAHKAFSNEEIAPIMEQLFGLRILLEQAEIDSLRITAPSNEGKDPHSRPQN